MKKSSYIALALLGAVSFNQVSAAVITFDGLGGTWMRGTTFLEPGKFTRFSSNPVTIGGFTFQSPDLMIAAPGAFGGGPFYGPFNSFYPWNGSDIMLARTYLDIQKADGGWFSLFELDLADTAGLGTMVTFLGVNMTGDGMRYSAKPAVTDLFYNWVVADDFTPFWTLDLHRVHVVRVTPKTDILFAVDNLDIPFMQNPPQVPPKNQNSVPEPGTLAILMAGLLPFGFMTRRRMKKTNSI